MINVLPEIPGFGTRIARGLGEGLGQGFNTAAQMAMKLRGQRAENEALKRLGVDLHGISDPELRKTLVSAHTKKKEDQTQKFETGLETIEAMRNIVDKGNVGRFSSIPGLFPGETAKDRAELSQLGKSLIPLVAAGVPIRNMKEFEEYKKTITDPSSPISEMRGALDGLERIFRGKLSPDKTGDSESRGAAQKSQKVQFDISNPEHKAKRDQALKKSKGDQKKAKEILDREFYL